MRVTWILQNGRRYVSSFVKDDGKDKLYMPLGNLDSISTLVDFYKTNDDYPLLAKAYYLLGRKQSDMGNYPSALISFRKVVALLDEMRI